MRSVKILQSLMIQKYPVGIDELAEKFDVSGRTIRSDIKEMNNVLSENNLPLVYTIRNKGVTIELTEKQKREINDYINEVNIDYYSNNKLRVMNLLLEFSFGNIHYVYGKQDEFQVSKSTIDNDMRIVRKILSDYHLSLNTEPSSSIRIEGSERAIRVMLFNTINKFSGPIDIYDATKIKSSIYQVLFQFVPLESFEKVSSLYEQYLNDDDMMYKNQSVLFILIWVNRLKLGYILSGEINKDAVYEDNIGAMINDLKNLYNIHVNQPERNYIRLILETLVSRTVKNTSAWTIGQIITLELINHVHEALNLQLNNEEKLFSGLFKHIVKLISRLENNMQIRNPLTDEIKNTNPKIFESIQSFDFDINKEQSVKITEDEIAFIAIYFLMSISQVRQKYNFLYKAVVFCNHGKATGKLLAQMLEENFDIDVVAVLSSTELSLMNKIDVDIAFSTIPLEIDTLPLLVVDSLLINQNYKRVERFLDNHRNRRRKVEKNSVEKPSNNQIFEDILKLVKKSGGKINERVYRELKDIFKENHLNLEDEAALPNLIEVLEDNHLLFNLEVDHWTDAISKTAQPLLDKNIVTASYIESMIEALKVNGPYIVMGPHLALAHAKPEDGVNRIGVSVSKLKKPIKFGHKENDPVKIIFSIATMDSYTHINIMKDIFELMNNDHKMQKLLNSESKREFKNILINN